MLVLNPPLSPLLQFVVRTVFAVLLGCVHVHSVLYRGYRTICVHVHGILYGAYRTLVWMHKAHSKWSAIVRIQHISYILCISNTDNRPW